MKIYLDSPFLPSQQVVYDSETGASKVGKIPVALKVDFDSPALDDIQVGSPVSSRLNFWLVVGAVGLLAVLAFRGLK